MRGVGLRAASATAADMPPEDSTAREFVFGSSDFHRIRKLIHAHAGIALAASKHEMVYSRLAPRLRARNLTRFADYIGLIERDEAGERQAFVNALTTNLTSFFREPHHFAQLARAIERRRAAHERINIWCCASSTGEEPYSIAMTVAEAFASFTPFVSILATDVDTAVLEKARAGVYAADRVAKLHPEQLRRFFVKGSGSAQGTYTVRRELRELVTFRQVNLLDSRWPVRGPFDAIFCRNVMIYFDRPTQRDVLLKLAPLMREDGLLFAGHSESFVHSADVFRLRGGTVYELARTPRSSGAA